MRIIMKKILFSLIIIGNTSITSAMMNSAMMKRAPHGKANMNAPEPKYYGEITVNAQGIESLRLQGEPGQRLHVRVSKASEEKITIKGYRNDIFLKNNDHTKILDDGTRGHSLPFVIKGNELEIEGCKNYADHMVEIFLPHSARLFIHGDDVKVSLDNAPKDMPISFTAISYQINKNGAIIKKQSAGEKGPYMVRFLSSGEGIEHHNIHPEENRNSFDHLWSPKVLISENTELTDFLRQKICTTYKDHLSHGSQEERNSMKNFSIIILVPDPHFLSEKNAAFPSMEKFCDEIGQEPLIDEPCKDEKEQGQRHSLVDLKKNMKKDREDVMKKYTGEVTGQQCCGDQMTKKSFSSDADDKTDT